MASTLNFVLQPMNSLRTSHFLKGIPVGLVWELARFIGLTGCKIQDVNLDSLRRLRNKSHKDAASEMPRLFKELFGLELQNDNAQFAAAFKLEKAAQVSLESDPIAVI